MKGEKRVLWGKGRGKKKESEGERIEGVNRVKRSWAEEEKRE